jgi:hypothetical protein
MTRGIVGLFSSPEFDLEELFMKALQVTPQFSRVFTLDVFELH